MSGGGGVVCTKCMAKPNTENIHYVNYAILFNHYNDLAFVGAMQYLQTTRCSGCHLQDLPVCLYIFKHLNTCISRA